MRSSATSVDRLLRPVRGSSQPRPKPCGGRRAPRALPVGAAPASRRHAGVRRVRTAGARRRDHPLRFGRVVPCAGSLRPEEDLSARVDGGGCLVWGDRGSRRRGRLDRVDRQRALSRVQLAARRRAASVSSRGASTRSLDRGGRARSPRPTPRLRNPCTVRGPMRPEIRFSTGAFCCTAGARSSPADQRGSSPRRPVVDES